jgi:ATP-binding cassette subfamily B protein
MSTPGRNSTERPELQLLSATPGRQRWYVRALGARPAFARRLEQALRRHEGILEVHANPASSRVLVRFVAGTPGLDVEQVMIESVRLASQAQGDGGTSADASGGIEDEPRVVDSWLLRFIQRFTSQGAGGKAAAPAPLARMLQLGLPEPRKLVLPATFSALSQALGLLRGVVFVAIINTARGQPPRYLRALGLGGGRGFVLLSLLSLAVVAADFMVGILRRRSWHALGQSTTLTLRRTMYSHILRQDLSAFDASSVAQLTQIVDRDCERIGRFVAKAGDTLVDKGLVLVVAVSTLFAASPALIGLIALLVPLMILPGRLLSKRIGAAQKRLAQAEVALDHLIENTLSNIVNVKSFSAEQKELTSFVERSTELASASTDAYIVSAVHARGVESILLAGWYAAASFSGHLAASGRIEQSTYTWLLFLIPRLLDAPADLEELTRLYDEAQRAARGLSGALDIEPRIHSGPLRLPKEAVEGELAFERVTFGYRPGHPVVQDVSFRVGAGQTFAIVGPTGSGKSTLLRLLMRFYDVDDGAVRVDGHDVRELDLGDLRNAIGLVAQEAYLFDGTIGDNVRYGRADASDAEVFEALEAASALALVQRLPQGLETPVGERGRLLSGGERQRIALARTLLARAPILALDEATSQLDYETEAAIQQSLQRMVSEARQSVLVVAHRLATIRRADWIVVLEDGRVTEQGVHDDLVTAGGLYQILWELQVNAVPGGRTPFEVRVRHDE